MVLEPPDVIEEEDLTDSDREILDVLADGRLTKGAIVGRTGLHRNTVRNRLDVLVAADAVDAVHKGTKLYELIDDPRDDEPTVEDDPRGRLQNAHEARDDAQARADRLADEVADLEAQLDAGALAEADVERIRSGVDAARTALEGQSPNIDMAQSELEGVQEVLEDV